jgi:hypothetical protein
MNLKSTIPPTFSFMGWVAPFPLTCTFSSIGSCYLSCLVYLCYLPVPVLALPTFLPIPHWWEPNNSSGGWHIPAMVYYKTGVLSLPPWHLILGIH